MNPELQLTADQRQAVEEFRKRHRTALLALLFSDVEGSTALRGEMGELPAADLIERHKGLIRKVLAGFADAQEISTAGDSLFLVFAKPSDAVRFALLTQKQLRDLAARERPDLRVRMGIHLGEVVVEEDAAGGPLRDVLGMQVDIAARVTALSGGGQILMTRGVFDNARQILKGQSLPGIVGLTWLSHGPYLIKGFDEPLAICEVGETALAPLRQPPDCQAGKRATVPGTEPVLGWRPAVEQVVPGTEWELEEKLGEGGFGEVWLGRQRRTKEQRVFKFCFRADRLRSLKREVTLFRMLKEVLGERDDIARLHEVQFEEAPYYLELEYTAGGNLSDWIEARGGFDALPMDLRLEIVAQTATALAAAHSVGVIHRDVKPSNVLIEERKDGSIQVRLTDFGIGELMDRQALDRIGITAAGFTVMAGPATTPSTYTGTHLYMAPELLAGRPPSIQSDIYSLGVLLYQMIVGDLSHPVATDWEEQVEDPLLRDDLHRCLAGDPARRFPSADELARNLRALPRRREEVAAREAAARKHLRARRFAQIAVGALTVIALIGAIAVLFLLDRTRRAQSALARETTLRKEADEARGRAEREQYYSHIALVEKCIQEDHFSRARELLVACPEAYRGWEWGRLQYLCNLDLMTLKGHADSVLSVAFSADGKRFATGSNDELAKLWDMETGRELLTFEGHTGAVRSVVFGPDGRSLATAGADGTVRLWDLNAGRELLVVARHPKAVSSVAFSPQGNLLASASWDQTAVLWNVGTSESILTLKGHSHRVNSVAFSPDGKRIATASNDHTAKVWQAETGRELLTLRGHTAEVSSIVFSPDGRRIATASTDKTAKIWEAEAGRQLLTLRGHTAELSSVAFSSDGRHLATASTDNTAKIWEAETGREVLALRGHGDALCCVTFSRDGKRIATACSDGTVNLWDAGVYREFIKIGKLPSQVVSAAYSPDGKRLAAGGYGTVTLWDVQRARELRVLKGHLNEVVSVAFGPDGRLLATASSDQTAKLWDAETGRQRLTPLENAGNVYSIAFSPDGKRLATASLNKGAQVYETETGRELLTLKGHSGTVRCITFSPDGSRLATGSADKTARLWDAETARQLLILRGHSEGVSSIAFSPDSARLATGSEDGTVNLWESQTGQERMTLKGFAGPVLSLAFSSDGRRLAMTGLSPLAKVWDTETGREVLQLKGHTDSLAAIAFSPDGRSLATGGYDRTIILWPAFPWKLDAYPHPSGASFQERIELFKRAFWKSEIAAAYATAPVGPAVPREGAREDRRQSLQLCAKNLEKIHAGLVRYRAKHKDELPGWLSDLVPDHISSDTLLCPADPIGKANFYPDPKIPCSYAYQFSDTPVKGYAIGGSVDHTGLTSRQWKTRQLGQYGDIVPTVRCTHHQDDPLVLGGVFNLSFGGRLYFSALAWETAEKTEYPTTGTAASIVPLSPPEGAVLDNGRTDRLDGIVWDFDWSDVAGATEYNLDVRKDGAASPMIYRLRLTNSAYRQDEPSSYILDFNRLNWKWKVRAMVGGIWGPWSETRSFDVEPVNTDLPTANAFKEKQLKDP